MKVLHIISQQSKKEERFTAKLGENISECLASYDRASAEYGVSVK